MRKKRKIRKQTSNQMTTRWLATINNTETAIHHVIEDVPTKMTHTSRERKKKSKMNPSTRRGRWNANSPHPWIDCLVKNLNRKPLFVMPQFIGVFFFFCRRFSTGAESQVNALLVYCKQPTYRYQRNLYPFWSACVCAVWACVSTQIGRM